MEDFRIQKLTDAILVQSRLSKLEARELAQSIEEKTDWEKEFNYQKIVNNYLESEGLLRTQNAKSCKIRRGTKV